MANKNYQFFQNQISGQSDQIYDYLPIIDATGDLTRISGINVIINSLRNLLLTPLGCYPFDPEFGSLLYKMLFEMSDDITQQKILYEVTTRVKRYDDRIDIDNVNITWSNDRKTAKVNVYIKKDQLTGIVSLSLSKQQSMFGKEDLITEHSQN